TARAKIVSRQGDHDAAEALARGALELIEPTDLLNAQGFVLLDLATVLAAAGKPNEAAQHARDAAGRFERKGNVPARARAVAAADQLAGAGAS
ncbi:MAG: hypothetical protein ACJ77E_00005, partial [Gaiellaceae bacterium]